jgi:hypothetical protein
VSAPPRPSRWPEWLVGALVLVVLVLAAGDRPMGLDEGIWYYVARAWVDHGVPPYQGPVENKTPGIFYLFTLAYQLFGTAYWVPRLLGLAAILATCAAVYALGRRLYGRTGALAAALACGFVMASGRVDGPEIAMTESFLVAFATLAILQVEIAVGATRRRWPLMLAAGALWGVAIAFKQIAVVTGAVLVLWAWARTPAAQRSLRRWLADSALIGAGALLATVASVVPLLLAGVSLEEYWRGAWLLLLEHGSMAPSVGTRTSRAWRLVDFPMAELALGVALFAILRRRLSALGTPRLLVLAWFAADLLGVLGSGYALRHQFKQVVPAVAVIVGGLFAVGAVVARERGVPARWIVPAALALVTLWLVPLEPARHLIRGESGAPTYTRQAEVGAWIRERTGPDDYVYGWVWAGLVQLHSGRRSPTRYFNKHFVKTREAVLEVQRDLRRHPPRMIVVSGKAPCWLARYLEQCCRLVRAAKAKFDIFEASRPGEAPPSPPLIERDPFVPYVSRVSASTQACPDYLDAGATADAGGRR